MVSLKPKVVRYVHWVAHVSGASTLLAHARPVMRILMYHAVGGASYPAGVFRAQMEWLGRRFSVVPLDAVVRSALENSAAPSCEVALTFDDGLRNHATVVYPLLRQLGLPATFFVCPSLIENGRWLWNHEMRQRLLRLDAEACCALGRRLGAREGGVESIVEWMKSLPAESRQRAESEVRAATPGFAPTPEEHELFDIMSWDQLLALDPSLVTVGSHTASHPILPTLDGAQLEIEVAGSRRWMEKRLGRPVRTFCYPNGAHDPTVRECVRASYEAAVTTSYGFVRGGDAPHALCRIPSDRSLTRFTWRMHRPTA